MDYLHSKIQQHEKTAAKIAPLPTAPLQTMHPRASTLPASVKISKVRDRNQNFWSPIPRYGFTMWWRSSRIQTRVGGTAGAVGGEEHELGEAEEGHGEVFQLPLAEILLVAFWGGNLFSGDDVHLLSVWSRGSRGLFGGILQLPRHGEILQLPLAQILLVAFWGREEFVIAGGGEKINCSIHFAIRAGGAATEAPRHSAGNS